jgi:hypothetical protein
MAARMSGLRAEIVHCMKIRCRSLEFEHAEGHALHRGLVSLCRCSLGTSASRGLLGEDLCADGPDVLRRALDTALEGFLVQLKSGVKVVRCDVSRGFL